MTSTFDILLTTKTARIRAAVSPHAGPVATAGAWTFAEMRTTGVTSAYGARSSTGFPVSAAGSLADRNFNVLAPRGAA